MHSRLPMVSDEHPLMRKFWPGILQLVQLAKNCPWAVELRMRGLNSILKKAVPAAMEQQAELGMAMQEADPEGQKQGRGASTTGNGERTAGSKQGGPMNKRPSDPGGQGQGRRIQRRDRSGQILFR